MLNNTGTLADSVDYDESALSNLPWYLQFSSDEVEDEMFEAYLNTKPRFKEAKKQDEVDYSEPTDNTEDFDAEKNDDKILKYLYDIGAKNRDLSSQKSKVASTAKEVDEQFKKMSSVVMSVCSGRSMMRHGFIYGGAGCGKSLDYSELITIRIEDDVAKDISNYLNT